MTNGGWSPRKQTMIGFVLVSSDVKISDPGSILSAMAVALMVT
jgi:hypothetical protein